MASSTEAYEPDNDFVESVNQYNVNTRKKIGCTSLVSGFDVSVIPPIPITCKVVEATDVERFMLGEGRALHVLNSHPHPNLPRMITSIHENAGKGRGYIFTNAYYGDLHSFVRTHKQVSEDMARPLFAQVLSAVIHCHKLRISLRDIKLGKIMFANEKMTKLVIADLDGAECFVPRVRVVHDQKGSPAYVAPEVLTGQPYDPFSADVWAMGVVLFVLLTGVYPFQDVRPARLFQKITNGAIAFPAHVSAASQALLLRLLALDPAARPPALELQFDPWLRSPFLSAPRRESVTVLSSGDPLSPPLPARSTLAGPSVSTVVAELEDEQIVPDMTEGVGAGPSRKRKIASGAECSTSRLQSPAVRVAALGATRA